MLAFLQRGTIYHIVANGFYTQHKPFRFMLHHIFN